MWRVATLLALGCASCTAHNPDYLPPLTGCTAGERACSADRPLVCDPVDGGTALEAAQCPSAGTCSDGHCAPPVGATPCTRQADCTAGQVCTAFVDGGHVATYCAPPDGAAGGLSACTTPSQCQSDLCLSTIARSICYLACQTDGDCGSAGQCRRFSVTVTGIEGTISGCAPR
jgi:hypothetical protein